MATLTSAAVDAAVQAVALVLFDDVRTLPPAYRALDERVGGAIGRAIGRPEFKAGPGTVLTVYPERSEAVDRVLIVGLGERDRFNGDVLRRGMARLLGAARAAKLAAVELHLLPGLDGKLTEDEAGHAAADGLSIGAFEFTQFKGAATRGRSGDDPADAGPDELAVRVDKPIRPAFEAGLVIGRGVSTARRLAATPPNVANPGYIADQCRSLADEVGLTCEVIDADQALALGMGGLLAVGRAGSHPPVMVILRWDGGGDAASSDGAPLLLVGKTVTFDTGGYSLKVGGSMRWMKYDKCGGMAVIGAMEAIARLKLPHRVVGILACAENMIDQQAYRVDDILTMYNGVTVEVTNTDAEGRLVLADALAYGTRTYAPRAVIDLATLTGGVRVALGTLCAGMFCNDDALGSRIDAAADFTGERVWRLPLWEEYRQRMSPPPGGGGSTSPGLPADVINSVDDRLAQPIQGAAFLSFFVGDDAPTRLPTLPWVHLDIAGTATAEDDKGLFPKGPTAWGVRLLTHLVAALDE